LNVLFKFEIRFIFLLFLKNSSILRLVVWFVQYYLLQVYKNRFTNFGKKCSAVQYWSIEIELFWRLQWSSVYNVSILCWFAFGNIIIFGHLSNVWCSYSQFSPMKILICLFFNERTDTENTGRMHPQRFRHSFQGSGTVTKNSQASHYNYSDRSRVFFKFYSLSLLYLT